MSEPGLAERIRRQGHELRDVSAGRVGWGALAFAVCLASAHFALSYAFRSLRAPAPPPPTHRALERTHEPRLQINAPADLASYLTRENDRLATYGWIDHSHGIARIPIERALELATRGARAKAKAGAP